MSSEDHHSTPQWLLEAVGSSVSTKEYDKFSKGFADQLHQELLQNHLVSFGELTDAERQVFIDSAMSKMGKTSVTEPLFNVLSTKIDESLHAWVGKQLLLDGVFAEVHPTRTDLQLDGLYDAIIAIIRHFPSLRFRLRSLFNCEFPKKLRPPVWHALLQNQKIRRQYMNRVASDPRRGLSVMDSEIAKKCDSLLNDHVAFAKFKGSTGALYAMRNAISYFHYLVDAGNTLLAQSEFLLFCPFLHHVSSAIPRRQSPHPALITVLIEEYISFIESRPPFICKPSLEDEQCKHFFTCVANALEKLNPELVKLIAKWPSRELPEGYPTASGLSPALAAIAQPLVRNMFVGFVNHKVLLYIWDQYLLGIDIPGFACEIVSILVAIVLHLASSAIVVSQCVSVPDGIECIRDYGLTIQVQQMRYTIHQYFGKQLTSLMPGFDTPKEQYAGQPPILLLSPGYDGRPTDRLRERQLLEKARRHQDDEEKRHGEEMQARLAELESTLQRRLNESEQRFATIKQEFNDQLRLERERRTEVEEKALRQATELKSQVENLRHEKDTLAGHTVKGVTHGMAQAMPLQAAPGIPQARPEVQQLIDHYLGQVQFDTTTSIPMPTMAAPVAAPPLPTPVAPVPPPPDNTSNAPAPTIDKQDDPRYEDPLKFCDPVSQSILSGIIGAAGPSAARLVHGGNSSKLTSPGYTVINHQLDGDGQQFVDRLRAATENAEVKLFNRVLDSAALADMSDSDRLSAVSRVLAAIATPGS